MSASPTKTPTHLHKKRQYAYAMYKQGLIQFLVSYSQHQTLLMPLFQMLQGSRTIQHSSYYSQKKEKQLIVLPIEQQRLGCDDSQ